VVDAVTSKEIVQEAVQDQDQDQEIAAEDHQAPDPIREAHLVAGEETASVAVLPNVIEMETREEEAGLRRVARVAVALKATAKAAETLARVQDQSPLTERVDLSPQGTTRVLQIRAGTIVLLKQLLSM
jgi:hypothetical protein